MEVLNKIIFTFLLSEIVDCLNLLCWQVFCIFLIYLFFFFFHFLLLFDNSLQVKVLLNFHFSQFFLRQVLFKRHIMSFYQFQFSPFIIRSLTSFQVDFSHFTLASASIPFPVMILKVWLLYHHRLQRTFYPHSPCLFQPLVLTIFQRQRKLSWLRYSFAFLALTYYKKILKYKQKFHIIYQGMEAGKGETKESEQISNSYHKSIRRSESDRRSLRLKTSENQQIINSERTKIINSKLNKRFKTEERQTNPEVVKEEKVEKERKSPINQGFYEDHHNTESLAELMQQDNRDQEKISQLSKKQSIVKILTDEEDQNEDITGRQTTSKESFSSYTEGNYIQLQDSFKKKLEELKIKTFSNDEVPVTKENRYIIKSDSQKRMDERYWKGQQRISHQIQSTKEFQKLMREYQVNKRNLLQQSVKKYSMKKIFLQKNSNATSLPKITVNTAALLSAEITDQPVEKKTQSTLSLTKIEGSLKKNRSKRCCERKIQNNSTENIEEVEKVLRRKGIELGEGTVKKGLASMKLVEHSQKIGLALKKDLVSNPQYKKFPLNEY